MRSVNRFSRWLRALLGYAVCSAMLALNGCGTPTVPPPEPSQTVVPTPSGLTTPAPALVLPETPADTPAIERGSSRWVPVPWSDLPGLGRDDLVAAWNAWLKSCERAPDALAALCPEIRQLSLADEAQRWTWLVQRWQPYRIDPVQTGTPSGLLTGYYEPEFEAQRVADARFRYPLYAPPAGLRAGSRWYSRQEIDTLPEAQNALRDRVLAYLADPVDVLVLQIQGSGRVRLREPDGQTRRMRLAFAGHNGHPYQSVGRWLLDQGELRDATWPSISQWLARQPLRVNEVLWRNPRVVFFRLEALSDFDAGFGPRGAQGVALTPGRSIAVDPGSIPLGTPVWLHTEGTTLNLQQLVLAQDTGAAIVGARRADLFLGWGDQAGELAGRLRQPVRLWALWPRKS
ncbi:MAG: murein transglycosylase A [Rhodoferax sp.]